VAITDANLFNSLAEAQEVADVWVMDYNEQRPEDYLGKKIRMEQMTRTYEIEYWFFYLKGKLTLAYLLVLACSNQPSHFNTLSNMKNRGTLLSKVKT